MILKRDRSAVARLTLILGPSLPEWSPLLSKVIVHEQGGVQVPLTFVVFGQNGDKCRTSTDRIANDQWQKLYAFLQCHPRVYAGQEEKRRRFVEAVHWILRTGAQWRELPDDFGKWNGVFKRYARWEENGMWTDMFTQFAQDPDMAAVMPESTAVRAHMCAAGGSKKGGASTNSA